MTRVTPTRFWIVATVVFLATVTGGLWAAVSPDAAGFPDGFDAVAAAPASHHVLFENALVRVLEVTVPPPGTSEPMHHHRWPGFFLDWERGGKPNHLRYHRADGTTREIPSTESPIRPGHWVVQWM